MQLGDCVTVPDGRIGRIRDVRQDTVRVRLMCTASHAHQFVWYKQSELHVIACPKGWMSSKGYIRYLKVTLAKMEERNAKKK